MSLERFGEHGFESRIGEGKDMIGERWPQRQQVKGDMDVGEKPEISRKAKNGEIWKKKR